MSAPAATEPSAHSEAPFVGLRPFDTSDAKWFFGREREIAALTRKLRASRFTAVVGPSGSGKSSIVRAGVVPLLQTDGWLKVIAKPGSAPLERLAAALSEAAPPGPLAEARRLRFEALLRASAFGLANVAETLRSEAPALFIVIDQFEEIFRFGDESDGVVQAAMKEEARAFIELLLTAGSREGGSTHICITMRSDYFGNCSSYVGLAEAVSASQFLVPLPLRAQMEESIRGPVAKAGSRIEEALIQRLLVDVVEEVDQLPLLQHTLRRLWETASGDPRTMHEQDYVAVGRISGSIDQKAEDIVEKLVKQNPRDLATMERVMKALSDLDERSRASRRRQNRNELEALVVDSLNMNPMDARKSLTRVLDTMRREDTSFLQIADEDDAEIDIGHEALIRSWKRLSGAKRDFVDGWLREERRDGDRWRGYVMRLSDSGPTISGTEEHSLRRWLRRSSLGKVWSARYGNRWDEVEDLRWRSRRMRQITWSAVACAVIVLVAIGYSVGQPHYAEIVAHGARLNALSLAHEARGQASDGNSRVAVLLSVDALQQVAGVKGGEDLAEPEQALVDALARPVEIARLPIGARAYGVAYSPDGRLLAATSSDRKAHVWRAESFQPVPLDESQNRSILTASFSPRGGAVMLTELLSRTVLLFRKWNAETGRPISDAIRESPCQSGPAFSADGAQIIASYHLSPTSAHRDPGGDGTSSASDRLPLCRWDATTGLVIERVPLNEGGDSGGGPIATGIHSVVWSPDGSRAVSLAKEEPNTDPNVPRLWDGRTGKPIGDLRGHGAPVVSAAFSADGSQIVTTSQDNTARVWEARTGQMIGSLRGHTGTVTSAAFSSDGLRIVTGSNDNTLRLWDATTFQPIGPPIRGHTSSVYAVAFSSDGRHVASGSDYKTVRVWDVGGRTGKYLGVPFQAHTDAVETIAVAPDGKTAVSGSDDGTLRIWDVATGRLIGQPLRGHSDSVNLVVYSPDGSRIVSASSDNTLRLWDANTGLPIGEPLRGHGDKVYWAAFSPDGKRIASASVDRTVRLWDSLTGRPIALLQRQDGTVPFVGFSPDGREIVSSSFDGSIRLWDARTGDPTDVRIQVNSPVMAAAFSPDGLRIVSASVDGLVRLWDAASGKEIGQPLRGHTDAVNTVVFSPDGHELLTASDDNTLRLWDAATGEPIGEPLRGHSSHVSAGVFTPDGKKILSSSTDHSIRVWDVVTRNSYAWPADSHSAAVRSVAYSPDGKRIVSASDDFTLRLWDAESGEALGQPLRGHTEAVASVAFSRDGSKIVSASADATVRLWDATTLTAIGEPLRGHFRSVYSAAFSPDGKRVVSASADRTLRIWDAVSGQPIGQPIQGHDKDVTSAQFSPDGSRILSTSADGTLRIWDAASAKQLSVLLGHEGEVTSAAFSPDGKTIVSGSVDQTLRLWDAESGKPLKTHRMQHADRVNSVAFSHNGRFVVSASNDKTVRVWDARTGLPIGAPLPGHAQGVLDAVFSPDGGQIVSASADSTLRIWTLEFPLDPSSAQARASFLCPFSGEEKADLSLVDPMTHEAAQTLTAEQKLACGGEPEDAADR